MLIHELIVRGIPADDSKTVKELRTSLRPLLQLEKKKKSIHTPPYSLQFKEEKEIIEGYLNEITSRTTVSSSEAVLNKFERNQSQLVHLLNRIDRIPTANLSSEEIDERAKLMVSVLTALGSLEKTALDDPNLSTILEQTHIDSDSDCDGDTPTRHTQQNTTSNSQYFPSSSFKSQRVEKWGVKFTGDPKQLSVHSFLERVAELRVARNTTEKELFESAIDLFAGKALTWYRANRDRFSDWKSLSQLLTRHFEPPDYKSRLFKEILERTQDSSESIVDYLSCMHALFRRYGNLPPEVQLDIVSRNLSPFYTTQLPVVNTIDELEEECLKLETKKHRVEHYIPPSRKKHNTFVEPDFAFISSDYHTQNDHVDAVLPREQTPRKVTCWNCRMEGHLNKDCRSPRTLHCYKCGTPDVTTRTCPKCSSGNGARGNQ